MRWRRNSARESAARHGRRERRGLLLGGRGLLRWCLGRIGRRRGGAAADDLLRLWRWRRRGGAAFIVRRGIGIGGSSGRGSSGLALALRFRGALLRRLGRRRNGRLRIGIVDLLLA